MEDIIKKIYEYSLEEIMGECFGRYSKYIIQERAIPDIRDGLKPVQRRILYAMYRDKNTFDKSFRKSAKTVGNVIGNYHPHGDTSVYEAMVRMSQEWKMKNPYIIMHGNNGSVDGDTAAAMRYTEAKLSKISNELLKNIDKDTVELAPNFDDTALEPTVLPAKYPNLLVNGSTGISAGYATNIPPHNIGEVIEATIKRIDNPNSRLDTIMTCIKGPDFPTGGTIEGIKGIKDAYETGKGKIVVSAKTSIDLKKRQIVIDELPYEVNKSVLVSKMDEIRIDKKIEGISEVRDESDRDGLRIVVELKKNANYEFVLNYLLKNTDLRVNYNFNMVAIDKKRPRQVGLLAILDAYIDHIKEVTTRKTKFELNHAEKRLHIIEGLIKALAILDEVIRTIRQSANKGDAKNNLVKNYKFTEIQAEAIVMLQLYRLTNTDVTLLEEESSNLQEIINELNLILNDETNLKSTIKKELREIKKEYNIPRLTIVTDEIKEIKLDEEMLIVKEEVIVTVTKQGYIKRTSLRSYKASNKEEAGIKEDDYIIGMYEVNTLDTILLFTDLGNYLYVPVHIINDIKWKDLGKHISNIVDMSSGESIIKSIPVYDFEEEKYITTFTQNGYVKRTLLRDYKVQRYQKSIKGINLKNEDRVVNVTDSSKSEIFIATHRGYGLWYETSEVAPIGIKGAGVKAITLKEDHVINGIIFDKNDEYVVVITDKNTGKRIKLSEFDKTHRARKGLLLIREVKTNIHRIKAVYVVNSKAKIGIYTNKGFNILKLSELTINDRYSTGTHISKENIITTFIENGLVKKQNILPEEEIEELTIEKHEVSIEEIDDKILTIEDFLDDIDF